MAAIEGFSMITMPVGGDIGLLALAFSAEEVTVEQIRGQRGYRVVRAEDELELDDGVAWWEPSGHMVYLFTSDSEGALALAESLTAVDEATWRAAIPEATLSN